MKPHFGYFLSRPTLGLAPSLAAPWCVSDLKKAFVVVVVVLNGKLLSKLPQNLAVSRLVKISQYGSFIPDYLGCLLSKGNQAITPKFERPNGKNTKSKIFLKSVQNWCAQLA